MRSESDDPKSTGGGSRRRRAAVAIATGVVLSCAAVLPASGGAAPRRPTPSEVAAGKITYTKQTVLVPTATVNKQLAKVSADGATYTFKSSHGVLGRLKNGSVMLLQNLAVRDVTKVRHSHGKLIISTTPAAITDLIANGTLSWDKALPFSKGFGLSGSAVADEKLRRGHLATPTAPERFGLVPMTAGHTITIKGKTHSYNYSAGFKEEGKSVEVTITISKSSPVELEAKITGTLNNLSSSGKIGVSNGALSSAKMVANKVNGKFKLTYSAKPLTQFGLGKAGGIVIELPAEIAVPFAVGPVPFFVGIKVAFIANAGFSGFDQKISGDYTIDFNGAGGLQVSKSGATSPSGVIKGLSDIILNAANAVKSGPLSFSFGARMPEIDLGLGVKGLNVAGNLTLLGETGIATYGGSCDTRQVELQGVAGADASFFGFSTTLGTQTLFDKKFEASYPKGCGTFP